MAALSAMLDWWLEQQLQEPQQLGADPEEGTAASVLHTGWETCVTLLRRASCAPTCVFPSPQSCARLLGSGACPPALWQDRVREEIERGVTTDEEGSPAPLRRASVSTEGSTLESLPLLSVLRALVDSLAAGLFRERSVSQVHHVSLSLSLSIYLSNSVSPRLQGCVAHHAVSGATTLSAVLQLSCPVACRHGTVESSHSAAGSWRCFWSSRPPKASGGAHAAQRAIVVTHALFFLFCSLTTLISVSRAFSPAGHRSVASLQCFLRGR